MDSRAPCSILQAAAPTPRSLARAAPSLGVARFFPERGPACAASEGLAWRLDAMNASPPEPIRPALTHEEIRLVIIGILVAMFLAALDQTIVATALPTIGRELGRA